MFAGLSILLVTSFQIKYQNQINAYFKFIDNLSTILIYFGKQSQLYNPYF